MVNFPKYTTPASVRVSPQFVVLKIHARDTAAACVITTWRYLALTVLSPSSASLNYNDDGSAVTPAVGDSELGAESEPLPVRACRR